MNKEELLNYDYSKLTLEELNTYENYERSQLLSCYHQWLEVMRRHQKRINL